MKEKGKRIGIMGGTFNPIHIGHLIIAENAREKYKLDTVLFMPNSRPAYKSNVEIASVKDRLRMVEMAVSQNKHFQLSTLEIERAGYTFTYETLAELRSQHPENNYYFIIGADSLFSLEKWRNPEQICSSCVFLLANRYDTKTGILEEQIEKLHKELGAVVYKLDCPNIDVSSQMLRSRVADGRSITYLVPGEVEDYIRRNRLYCQEVKNAEK